MWLGSNPISITSCVVLSQSLCFSVPFSCKIEIIINNNTNICFIELWGFNILNICELFRTIHSKCQINVSCFYLCNENSKWETDEQTDTLAYVEFTGRGQSLRISSNWNNLLNFKEEYDDEMFTVFFTIF